GKAAPPVVEPSEKETQPLEHYAPQHHHPSRGGGGGGGPAGATAAWPTDETRIAPVQTRSSPAMAPTPPMPPPIHAARSGSVHHAGFAVAHPSSPSVHSHHNATQSSPPNSGIGVRPSSWTAIGIAAIAACVIGVMVLVITSRRREEQEPTIQNGMASGLPA